MAAVAAPFTASVGLASAGFTSAGVAAGSFAAGVQSVAYAGATTGMFSALQSAGAAGLAASTKIAIGAGAGAATYAYQSKFFHYFTSLFYSYSDSDDL